MKLALLVVVLLTSATTFAQKLTKLKKLNKQLTLVSDGDFVGVMKGKELIQPCIYDDVYVSGQFMYYYKGDSTFLASALDGRILLNDPRQTGEELITGVAAYGEGGVNGLITSTGTIILEPGAYNFDYSSMSTIVVDAEGKSGVVGENGKIIIPLHYKSARYYDDNGFDYVVKSDSVYYAFLSRNEHLIEGYNPYSERIHVKATETSIKEWFAFLSWEGLTLEERMQLFPDTTKVEAKLLPAYRSIMKAMQEEEWYGATLTVDHDMVDYKGRFSIPVFDESVPKELYEFPITGVTKEQVTTFLNKQTFYYTDNTGYGLEVRFRLPLEKEWEEIALSGLSNEMKSRNVLDSLNVKGCMLLIYKNMPNCKNYAAYLKASFGEGSTKVNQMNLDLNGNKQLFGNVAEMTNDSSFAKGGSYVHTAKEAAVNNDIPLTGAASYVGFRSVIEFIMRE